MKVNVNDIIELLYKPMTDPLLIEIIDKMGLQQPIITEEYLEEQAVYVDDSEKSGIVFTFKELNGFSKQGELCLVKIDFTKNDAISLPYNLDFMDNYIACCKKLGRKADFKYKRFMKTSKVWLEFSNTKIPYKLIIDFTNTEFSKINYVLIMNFEENEINKKLIENKD
jgi:hypothetical protein